MHWLRGKHLWREDLCKWVGLHVISMMDGRAMLWPRMSGAPRPIYPIMSPHLFFIYLYTPCDTYIHTYIHTYIRHSPAAHYYFKSHLKSQFSSSSIDLEAPNGSDLILWPHPHGFRPSAQISEKNSVTHKIQQSPSKKQQQCLQSPGTHPPVRFVPIFCLISCTNY